MQSTVDGRGGESSKTQARDGHVSSRVTRAIHADQRVDAYKPAVAAGGAGLVVNLIDNADAAPVRPPRAVCADKRTDENLP